MGDIAVEIGMFGVGVRRFVDFLAQNNELAGQTWFVVPPFGGFRHSTLSHPCRYTLASLMETSLLEKDTRFFPQVLVLWIAMMGLSALGVWAVHSLGPWILLRDQTRSSWHYLEEGWKTIDEAKAAFGTPEYIRAAEKAEPLFRKAAELATEVGKYRIDLARVLHAQGRFEDAYQEAVRGIEYCSRDDAFAYGFVGELALRMEEWEEAEGLLRIAKELDPESPWHRERLATALLEQGKIEEGIEEWRERLEGFPSLPSSRLRAAEAAFKVQQWAAAAEWFSVPAEEGLVLGKYWLMLAVARAATTDIDGAAIAIAQYNREQKIPTPVMPDFSVLGLSDLDPILQKNLKAAYRRGFAARWKSR